VPTWYDARNTTSEHQGVQYWESVKLADETAKNTQFSKNITTISETDHDQASPPLSRKGKKVSISFSGEEVARWARTHNTGYKDKRLADHSLNDTSQPDRAFIQA
jgi:hypothetical protein